MTGAELVDEIQALTGRTGDTVLVTDARCTRWLNEAQRDIVDKIPGLPSQNFKNTTSHDTTASLRYSITDITVGDTTDDRVARVTYVAYLNGLESKPLGFLHVDEFDEKYPDPTHSDIATSIVKHWTRRGSNIEIMPLCATAYHDDDLRFDGDWYPRDFTTNDASASDLSQCDDGLIFYGVAQAWGAIGDEVKAKIWEGKYNAWWQDRKDEEDTILAWGGGLFEALE